MGRGAAQPGPSRSAIVAACAGALVVAVFIVATPDSGGRVRAYAHTPRSCRADDRQPSYMQEHRVLPA